MNWDEFEHSLRESIENDAPAPSQSEADASWEKIEPKLFPEKKRGAAWFSLNTILTFLLVSIGVASMWLIPKKSVQKTAKNIELDKSTFSSKTYKDLPDRNQKETSSQSYLSNNTQKKDKTVSQSTPPQYADKPSGESNINKTIDKTPVTKKTTPSEKKISTKSTLKTTISTKQDNISSKPITGKKNSSELLVSQNSTVDINIEQNSTQPAHIKTTEMQTLPGSESPLSQTVNSMADNTSVVVPQLIVSSEQISSEIVTEGDKKFLVTTEIVDSANIHAKIYRKEMIDSDLVSINEELSEAANENATKPKKSIIQTIKQNLQPEKENIKIAKPSNISIYTAGIAGVKASSPTVGGVFGLEWMQELNNKFSLIAGLRYRLSTMSANFVDSNTTFYDMQVDSVSSNQTIVTLFYNTEHKESKAKSMHIIEVPIYVNYSVVKDFWLQLGLDISVLLNTKNNISNQWKKRGTSTQNVSNVSEIEPGTDLPYQISDSDLKGKFGLGIHIGAQYALSPRIYARFAYNQLIKNYFSGTLKKQLGSYSASPNLQLGIGINLNKKSN